MIEQEHPLSKETLGKCVKILLQINSVLKSFISEVFLKFLAAVRQNETCLSSFLSIFT